MGLPRIAVLSDEEGIQQFRDTIIKLRYLIVQHIYIVMLNIK